MGPTKPEPSYTRSFSGAPPCPDFGSSWSCFLSCAMRPAKCFASSADSMAMPRALFEAVRQKSLAQWSHRTVVRNKSDHLLAGLLFDDAGHRMIPTHATKAGIRYRYYASTPVLHGEAKTAAAGSVSRVPAADIEAVVVKLLKEDLAKQE